MAANSILIVSYVFPPFPGIGGRRWAKFAKELSGRGYKVFVLAAKNPLKETSPWEKDIQDNPRITIKYLPLKYPGQLLSSPRNVFEKLKYRVALLFLKFTTRGNYYDRAVKWKRQLQNEMERLIEEFSIKNVIVSGAPFHLIYHSLEMKRKHPQINLFADFRDPWTNNPDFFGFASLSKKRQDYERKMEKEVVQNADVVISVAEEMNQHFKTLTDTSDKFAVIENGFDPEDYSPNRVLNKNKGKIRCVLTGTLYLNVMSLFAELVKSLAEMQKNQIEKYHQFEFDFYGDVPWEYKRIVKDYRVECIRFHEIIPLEKVYEKIASADLCMLFLQEHLGFSLSTKFCEYLSQRKKIIVFSKGGKTAEFITGNRLGYAAFPGNIAQILDQIIKDYKEDKLQFNSNFDIEKFSVPRLTDKLVTYLR